jgi:DNA repair protein RecO (recombination protein O)
MLIEDNAFVLFTRPQGETSLWLSVLTQHHGRLNLIYKGGQRKISLCAPFQPLSMAWKTTLRGAWVSTCDVSAFNPPLTGMANWSGLYANELLHKGLREHQDTSFIFEAYQQLLTNLARPDISNAQMGLALRRFEWRFLMALGYGFGLTTLNGQYLQATNTYQWIQDAWQECVTGILGAELLALETEANIIFSSALRQLLQDRLAEVLPNSASEMRRWWQQR